MFVDPAAEAAFTALDTELTGAPTSWPELTHAGKLEVAPPAVRRRAARLAALVARGAGRRGTRSPSWPPASRSTGRYLPTGCGTWPRRASEAGRRRPDLTPALDALTARLRDPGDELAMRFQQFTGAVMAKGVEDTAFYRWTRFVALNEVGGDPARFGVAAGGVPRRRRRAAARAGRPA